MAIFLKKEIPLRASAQTEVGFADDHAINWTGDLLIYGIHAEVASGKGDDSLAALPQDLGVLLQEFIQLEHFDGDLGTYRVARRSHGNTRLFGVVGLGPLDDVGGSSPFRVLGETTAKIARGYGVQSAAVALLAPEDTSVNTTAPRLHDHVHDLEHRGGHIALGLLIGGYKSERFRSTSAAPRLGKASILTLGSGPKLADAAEEAEHLARGVTLCRHLAESPANLCTPAYLAQAAHSIAAAAPTVFKLQVHDVAKCTALGMGCYLAVGAASSNLPHFIHLTYSPAGGDPVKKVALVGKSITFDSGGLNLKVHGDIEKMKGDMAGGAAVLGVAEALSHIRPEGIEVHFLLPAAENAVSGTGYRPSDIVTASNGKTVEVEDTDAEGRLALADALVYAERLGVEAIVDIATLTSACYVALGPLVGGLFTDSNQLAGALRSASQAAGESIWQLPLERRYRTMLDSDIADIKNYGGKPAGAITAALFLQEFVTPAVQWAHLDAGGPAFDFENKVSSGWGVLTLAQWVLSQSQPRKVATFGFKNIPPAPAKDTGHRGK